MEKMVQSVLLVEPKIVAKSTLQATGTLLQPKLLQYKNV